MQYSVNYLLAVSVQLRWILLMQLMYLTKRVLKDVLQKKQGLVGNIWNKMFLKKKKKKMLCTKTKCCLKWLLNMAYTPVGSWLYCMCLQYQFIWSNILRQTLGTILFVKIGCLFPCKNRTSWNMSAYFIYPYKYMYSFYPDL